MKTYLRYCIHVRTMEYPFKAPEYVQREAEKLKERCREYELKNAKDIFLIPIDVEEYSEVLTFCEKYKEYASSNLFYEHKFTKREMDNAEFYLLGCGALVENFFEEVDTYNHCCDTMFYREEQIGYYQIKKNGMGNKAIAFSYDYHFFISKDVKEAFEEAKLTNQIILPVYDKQEKEIVAYQLEAENSLPPLAELNKWVEYKRCPKCGKVLWEGIHIINHPFYIPMEWKSQLQDINCTSEKFPVSGRYYIISKKVYDILQELGAKKLMCEPIVFV